MSTRRPGPPPHTEDPYTRLISPHGIPVDQLVSVLQKEIRRSNTNNAVLAAYEMLTTSPEVAEHLWHRLKVIAIEDVGTGWPLAPVLLDSLHERYRDAEGSERIMMAVHAVRLLATSKKDRTSAEHTDLMMERVAAGERVAVPDYALCVHTKAGQEMGRGVAHWWDHGAQVNDELETADHSYRAELIALARAAERGRAPGPGAGDAAS